MKQNLTKWRLVDTGPHDGPANMAIDEALLLNFDSAISQPVLRLYGWQPPALSLGRFQSAAEVLDLGRCATAKVPVVRRITGGGVIYHGDELTYSLVCAPQQIPAAASVKASFRVLTSFLLHFYQKLGLDASYAVDHFSAATTLGERTDFCFAGKENFDILINGKKLGGNAQRRMRSAIFQHGSIPLRNSVATGLGFLRNRPAGIEGKTTSLKELEVVTDSLRLKESLVEAFAEALNGSLAQDGLTAAEAEAACRLREEKYRNDGWQREGVVS
jgi:lipoate-protein ligase A